MIPRQRTHKKTHDGAPAANGTTQAMVDRTRSGRSNRSIFTMILVAMAMALVNQQVSQQVIQQERTLLRETTEAITATPPTKYQSSPDKELHGKVVLKKKHKPGIAWLMSFPNSGTSYTIDSVARATNRSFASNYEDEFNAEALPIYPGQTEGPYRPAMSGPEYPPWELPDTYIITKTHCGVFCVDCGPDKYFYTRDEFLRSCTSAHGGSLAEVQRRESRVLYSHNLVQRAIHLYRNPMHNIIARFHHERKRWKEMNVPEPKLPPDNAEGLAKWCEFTKRLYFFQDSKFFGHGKIPEAPCHNEFYKWTLWHNRATEVIDYIRSGSDLGLPREFPVLKVFYEDYDLRFNETKTAILQFLQLDEVSSFEKFSSRKDYGSYFDEKELIQIKKLVKSVATNTTWADVKHYFKDVPDP